MAVRAARHGSRRDGDALCLRAHAHAAAPRAAPPGADLGAAWFFAAPGGVIVDLSRPLTDALRRQSRFQGQPAAWTGLMGRLGPDVLGPAGYGPCAPSRHGSFEACYCPSGTPAR